MKETSESSFNPLLLNPFPTAKPCKPTSKSSRIPQMFEDEKINKVNSLTPCIWQTEIETNLQIDVTLLNNSDRQRGNIDATVAFTRDVKFIVSVFRKVSEKILKSFHVVQGCLQKFGEKTVSSRHQFLEERQGLSLNSIMFHEEVGTRSSFVVMF